MYRNEQISQVFKLKNKTGALRSVVRSFRVLDPALVTNSSKPRQWPKRRSIARVTVAPNTHTLSVARSTNSAIHFSDE